ncbi:MAG TPA: hypothetical protein PKK40_03220 [Marmoricola sp.]|nr:hypothetical protein [Marmoricola sp.]
MVEIRVPRVELFAATAAGQRARITGEPISTCPYPADGTPLERVLRGAWLNAYEGDV